VEILAEGDAEAMERFERAIRRGPMAARVDDVDVEMVAPTGRFPGFTARR
jgi:acylphosphatase